jgi:putative Mg2+ transporter-C (MgtC) family protein
MTDLVNFVLNIGAALVLGMAIGVERHFRQHPAGLRTNALVSLGAALFVSLALIVPNESSPTRMASYVISGIGFLGGGVILREGLNVRGMNTAATLWCSGAVGTLAGMGFIIHGAIGTVAILFVNIIVRPIMRRIDERTQKFTAVETTYRIRAVCDKRDDMVIRSIFLRHLSAQPTMTLQGISSTQDAGEDGKTAVVAQASSSQRNDKYMNELVSRVSIEPSVSTVSWERLQGAGGE